MDATPRYPARELRAFALGLLTGVGVRQDIAEDVAEALLEADLLGHTTHGLALLAPYLGELDEGRMNKSGEPIVVARRSACETWDGQRLPGPWLTFRALDAATAMARSHGTGTVVIRHSHHIACLAVYVRRAAEHGLIALVQSSDPIVAAVAPHGGVKPFITPNPIAAGIPTSGDPILVDVSTSITSMGYARQQMLAGKKLPGDWLIDHRGQPTNDPGQLFNEPKGALLPLGGIDAGYKGFGLALIIEAMTAGLAGHGRADPPAGWGGTVFVQVFDPDAFAGLAELNRQMDFVADSARASPPREGGDPVRLPGERGLHRLREQLERGVALYPTILPALQPWGERLGVAVPIAI